MGCPWGAQIGIPPLCWRCWKILLQIYLFRVIPNGKKKKKKKNENSNEFSRPKPYFPRNPATVPSYYPMQPLPIFDNPAIFEKFDPDTLFWIFYYQQGTLQQYLAAKELKKQAWRFHKKYLTWFQRHEPPKDIKHDHETGTYVYVFFFFGFN